MDVILKCNEIGCEDLSWMEGSSSKHCQISSYFGGEGERSYSIATINLLSRYISTALYCGVV
jgi:hypothetical protein